MQEIRGIEVDFGTKEEILPGYSRDFPYIATRAELDRYREPLLPWHWHWPAELFYEEIPVKTLARCGLVSERECYRVFRDCLHTTPTGYILQFRLGEACRLLRQSDRPITEIAYACGFGSGSYFGRMFLRCIGCTPSRYRAAWRNKTNI